MNISPGMHVLVCIERDWFKGTVSRVVIEDGEEYILGQLALSPKTKFDKPRDFRVHIDDVKPWVKPAFGDY